MRVAVTAEKAVAVWVCEVSGGGWRRLLAKSTKYTALLLFLDVRMLRAIESVRAEICLCVKSLCPEKLPPEKMSIPIAS